MMRNRTDIKYYTVDENECQLSNAHLLCKLKSIVINYCVYIYIHIYNM